MPPSKRQNSFSLDLSSTDLAEIRDKQHINTRISITHQAGNQSNATKTPAVATTQNSDNGKKTFQPRRIN